MGGLAGFLLGYIIGGLTLLPLIVIGVLFYAYLTFTIASDNSAQDRTSSSIVQPGDDVNAIKTAEKNLAESFRASGNHEAEVAAGYFAVCREYVPGGVNGKPPERTSPSGSTTVSAPSPSVYQSMYRSIFDRKQNNNSPLDNKPAGKPQRKGGNVFYVVLRHGHLMLFDDEEQLEVRHVISLAHHDVSVYSGGDETPEGELFIKRNALCLSRRKDTLDLTPDGVVSKPFYLFSENCSFKEDFYFAMLRNQERTPGGHNNPPLPIPYEVKDIITLVQKLHSSEEHLQTRWINAVLGRIFLALYKTSDMENFFRSRITKKISRVKTPSFLSKISLRNIDMGNAAPVITNPRLKDLTVDGELVVEADVRYAGNIRIEVATTARIDLGSRFKAREVNLVLAVVVKRLEGHGMARIKPAPSNRIWVSFATMPKLEMTIEPIVSSRQITYTLILRQIENRIKEVIAESVVYPNWDDVPFYNTESKRWRGGIWADEKHPKPPPNAEEAAAQQGDVEEVQHLEGNPDDGTEELPQVERSISMPALEASTHAPHARKAAKSTINVTGGKSTGVSSGVETKPIEVERPRVLRSGSFAATSAPVVATDVTTVDAFKPASPPDVSHAADAMAKISALSQSVSPPQTPVGSPARPPIIHKSRSQSSASSGESVKSDKDGRSEHHGQLTPNAPDTNSIPSTSFPPTPSSASISSFQNDAASTRSLGSMKLDPKKDNSSAASVKSVSAETKRLSLAAIQSAKKWGWNALQRHSDSNNAETNETISQPMGRGRPLPPPGTPLPPPDKRTKTAPIPVPKRKPVAPPPCLPKMPAEPERSHSSNGNEIQRRPVPPPPLPARPRHGMDEHSGSMMDDDGLLVVAAPIGDSQPSTPLSEHNPTYVQPWAEDEDENENENENESQTPEASVQLENAQGEEKVRVVIESENGEVAQVVATSDGDPIPIPTPRSSPPELPQRRHVSTSPEEDGPELPTWMAAQEEEARIKSAYVDEDVGI
ncbi:hypothetical protein F5884DRAFT_903478 [Xylogone sp. PMI_703]|nr:hypothetical protein F5884DRAFT_903478 [Xylogone sp. PMI_703]